MMHARTIIPILIALASQGGCAKLLWQDLSRSFPPLRMRQDEQGVGSGTAQTSDPGNSDVDLRRKLESLRESDPAGYEIARELLQNSDSSSPDLTQQMLNQQTRAVISHTVEKDPRFIGVIQEGIAATPAVQRPTDRASPALPRQAPRRPVQIPAPTLPPQTVAQTPPVLPAANIPAAAAQLAIASSVGVAPAYPVVPATTLESVSETVTDASPEPDIDWEEVLPTLIDAIENDLATQQDGNAAIQQQVFLRFLYMIANRRDDAIVPVDSLPKDEREFLKHAIYCLMVWLDTDERHAASRKAALALRELRLAADYLANHSTLDVRNALFCREVLNYGDYTPFKSNAFERGAEVVLYVEIENFVSEQAGNRFETELRGDYEIVDARGQRVTSKVLPLDKQMCNNRRRDYFIAYRLWLPQDISRGDHSMVLTIEDVKGRKSNQATIDFRIR
jgi:hypothetical protein